MLYAARLAILSFMLFGTGGVLIAATNALLRKDDPRRIYITGRLDQGRRRCSHALSSR